MKTIKKYKVSNGIKERIVVGTNKEDVKKSLLKGWKIKEELKMRITK